MSQPSISFSRLSKFIAMAVNNDNDGERSNALEKLRDFHSSGFTVGDVNVATMRENEEYRREIEKTMTVITDALRALHESGTDTGFAPHRHKTISQRAEVLVACLRRGTEPMVEEVAEPAPSTNGRKYATRWTEEQYRVFIQWVEDNRHQLKFSPKWAEDYIRYAKSVFPDLHIGDHEVIRGKWRVIFNETIWSEEDLKTMLDNRELGAKTVYQMMGRKYTSSRAVERLLDPKINAACRRRLALRK